jgi:hypothetical protein
MRSRAYRRVMRERAVARALPVLRRLFGAKAEDTRVLRWADNLRKCSCAMCNSGDPHDRRMMRRAAVAARQELREI